MTYEHDIFDRPIGRAGGVRRERCALARGGSVRGLAFEIDWANEGLDGTLSITLAGRQIWSTADVEPRSGTLARFLDGMSRAWRFLLLQETYPHGISPALPSAAPALLEERAFGIDEGRAQAEAFRALHEVSSWLSTDREVPALWLMREGNLMVLESGGQVVRWAFADVVRTLRELGNLLAHRAAMSPASSQAAHEWHARESASDAELETISMGMSEARLIRLPLPARSRADIFRGVDEIRAAARMLAARVPDHDLALIIERIRQEPRHNTPELHRWSLEAVAELERNPSASPRLQGRSLARWVRLKLANEQGRVSPENLLESWNVAVFSIQTVQGIEAVSFWGPDHGPAILRNTRSRRSQREWASSGLFGSDRFTLAHELCHLLVDVDGSLPVAEVFGGVLPKAPEQRANAFAAEFLVPEELAGVVYQNAPTVDAALRELTSRYGVTKTLAAYQILKRFGDNSPVLTQEDFGRLQHVARQWRGRA